MTLNQGLVVKSFVRLMRLSNEVVKRSAVKYMQTKLPNCNAKVSHIFPRKNSSIVVLILTLNLKKTKTITINDLVNLKKTGPLANILFWDHRQTM